jgi:hypothetical protein
MMLSIFSCAYLQVFLVNICSNHLIVFSLAVEFWELILHRDLWLQDLSSLSKTAISEQCVGCVCKWESITHFLQKLNAVVHSHPWLMSSFAFYEQRSFRKSYNKCHHSHFKFVKFKSMGLFAITETHNIWEM